MNLEIPPPLPKHGVCLLCGSVCDLCLSHVIPKFVPRRLKRTGASGYFRLTAQPNRRVQDGIKDYMLCVDCEALFEKDETEFANTIYHPHLDRQCHIFKMSESNRRFATSVSWRIAEWMKAHGRLGAVPLDAHRSLMGAKKIWADYLLGKRSDVGIYKQHLVMMGLIESVSGVPDSLTNLNAYLMRGFDLDIRIGKRGGYVYANLAGFLVIGSIRSAAGWKGTLVEPGLTIGGDRVVGIELGEHIEERAAFVAIRMGTISQSQSEKITQIMADDINAFTGSETFDALNADWKLKRE